MGKLFNFFGQVSRTKNIVGGGMGLGLTISKMILQQFGGEIKVESKFLQGSVFIFKIPITGHLQEST